MRFIYVIYKLLPFVLIATLMIGCTSPQNDTKEHIAIVKTDKIGAYASSYVKSYPGKLKAVTEINLAFRIAGPLIKFPVDEGSFVKKGDLIAQIDPRDYELQLAATTAEYEQVKSEVDRIIELKKRESVPDNNYVKAILGLRRIEVKLQSHKNALVDTRLLAPFDGFIQKKMYASFETVGAGMPVVSLLAANKLEAEINITSEDFINRADFNRFFCIADAALADTFCLSLRSVTPRANLSQLYTTTFILDSVKQLAPGMSVMVTMVGEKSSSKLLYVVSGTALFSKDGSSFVWVIDSQNKVHARKVVVEKLNSDGSAVLSSGVTSGEIIVVAGVSSLTENQTVSTAKKESKSNVGGLL